MSLEGLLSGYLQIALDAMRDAMETELLIRDFALDPAQINVWRNADEALLRRTFKPVDLRERQAKVLGVNVRDLPGSIDYASHSKLLHVAPPLLFARSPESGHQAKYVLDALGEIMYHGISAVEALAALFNAINRSAPDPAASLAALRSSFEDIRKARAATVGIELAVKEALSEEGYRSVFVHENGLIVAFREEGNRADFFGTERTDFRRFHRDVSPERSAEFALNPLGSSEPT
jgi:hypothetical protein